MKKSVKTERKRLLSQIIIPAIISIALLAAGYLVTNPAVKSLLVGERRQMVHEMVNSVYSLLESYNEKVQRGEISLNEAQKIVVESIKQLRYGKNHSNYFWIQDYNGAIIYHPHIKSVDSINPQIAKSVLEITSKIAEVVKQQNEGFLSYDWYSQEPNSQGSLKESYFKGFVPWNWVVGTGFMLTDIDSDLKLLTRKVLLVLFFFLGGMLLILSLVLFRNFRNLQKILIADYELKKSEARFRGFAEHIDNGIMIFENETLVFVNTQFYKIFGANEHTAKNFNLENYLPDWEKARVKMILGKMTGNEMVELSTWLKPNGQPEKFVNLRFIFDKKAEIVYKYLVVQDQTQQKQTLTTIEILSENLTQSSESIVITDLNGNIEYVNPGFEKVTGYTFEEVKGKNPRILKSEKMSPMMYEDLWNTISKGEIWSGEILNQKKDGTLFWESTVIFPIKNRQNEIIKYSSIKTDISHNKRIEQELLAARDKAEENERFKIAFLNNVSHEVRTPLNAIYGFTQLLRNTFERDERVSEYLKIMEQNCHILLRLFEDILDVSSIESRAITLQKEDIVVKDLLLKIISKYNVQLTIDGTKPVEIKVNEDTNFETLVFFTDRKRITQVFDKLLSNAVKFTEEGHITISYDLYPENIAFHITDTGVGIPDEERDLIFNSFSHGQKMFVSLHKGVGLGLNIAKLLVEMLGGKLTFTSKEGHGSTFTVTFPTTDFKNYTINGKQKDDYQGKVSNKNILLAEDNDESFIYMEEILSVENTLVRAKTGAEAITLLDNCEIKFDCILMDILMPEMDGITASRIMRKKYPSMPIIAITAIGQALTGAEKNLFNNVLSKPVVPRNLMSAIYKVLEK